MAVQRAQNLRGPWWSAPCQRRHCPPPRRASWSRRQQERRWQVQGPRRLTWTKTGTQRRRAAARPRGRRRLPKAARQARLDACRSQCCPSSRSSGSKRAAAKRAPLRGRKVLHQACPTSCRGGRACLIRQGPSMFAWRKQIGRGSRKTTRSGGCNLAASRLMERRKFPSRTSLTDDASHWKGSWRQPTRPQRSWRQKQRGSADRQSHQGQQASPMQQSLPMPSSVSRERSTRRRRKTRPQGRQPLGAKQPSTVGGSSRSCDLLGPSSPSRRRTTSRRWPQPIRPGFRPSWMLGAKSSLTAASE
mmetsp:Transcript_49143/g.126741  ORF Transcript_49143/g.126741 Transcript_49143/m.126741 type:complete len:303 (+) Transcript_49143:1067-1975(+)